MCFPENFFKSAHIAGLRAIRKKSERLHSWSGIIFPPINYLAAICQTLPFIALRAPSASVARDRSSLLQSASAERAVGLVSFQAQSFRSLVLLRRSRAFRGFAIVRVFLTNACVYRRAWWQCNNRLMCFSREIASESLRSIARSPANILESIAAAFFS